jgi:hypothetical protein
MGADVLRSGDPSDPLMVLPFDSVEPPVVPLAADGSAEPPPETRARVNEHVVKTQAQNQPNNLHGSFHVACAPAPNTAGIASSQPPIQQWEAAGFVPSRFQEPVWGVCYRE